MDKTFAETQGQPAFDWNKWLDKAIDNPESVDTDDHNEKTMMAYSWVTCACGNQCAIIPRHKDNPMYPDHQPVDIDLTLLGSDFASEVEDGKFEEAKETLRLIEERAAVIIKRELTKLSCPQENIKHASPGTNKRTSRSIH